jgi:branched-chain amino acid aminotransferase
VRFRLSEYPPNNLYLEETIKVMTITERIPVQRTLKSRLSEIDFKNLEFGKYISDHMVVAEYKDNQWCAPVIRPYGEMTMTPAMLALHYGQAVFEGMKAFRMVDGNISIFRIQRHHQRFNKSLERMCMPPISEALFVNSLHALVELDQQWVPDDEGSALYIRPVVFATESRLGVKISDRYMFVVMTSPVGPYFNKPIRVKVEETFVRAAEGGTGYSKCAGNYGGAFYPTQLARQQGYDQVLWTDAKTHTYIDESGAMNVMFVLNGTLVTPQLTTALLDGVTRDSILKLAHDMGVPAEERKVSLDNLIEGFERGTLTEAFGAGTAAVVAPIATINIHGKDYQLPPVSENSFQMRVKKKLHNIRHGIEPDNYNWNDIIVVKQ